MISYREFFARPPPTNTRVFPISGMILIGKWRYPPTFFWDRFPLIFFLEGIPKQVFLFFLVNHDDLWNPGFRVFCLG